MHVVILCICSSSTEWRVIWNNVQVQCTFPCSNASSIRSCRISSLLGDIAWLKTRLLWWRHIRYAFLLCNRFTSSDSSHLFWKKKAVTTTDAPRIVFVISTYIIVYLSTSKFLYWLISVVFIITKTNRVAGRSVTILLMHLSISTGWLHRKEKYEDGQQGHDTGGGVSPWRSATCVSRKIPCLVRSPTPSLPLLPDWSDLQTLKPWENN